MKLLKPLFHSSQKPTCKLAASSFKYCDWMKVLAASLRVGFCDEWKRVLTFVVGIITTSGVGGAAKHVVKLLPGQTLQSLTHKLTPQHLQRVYKQQHQQRLQQQSQQSPQRTQPSQAQPSTTKTVEAAPKSASPVSYCHS